MLPYIATERRGRDRWYWRIEDKDGYSPWVGPYPTDTEAVSVARDFCKREGDDGYARSLLKSDGSETPGPERNSSRPEKEPPGSIVGD